MTLTISPEVHALLNHEIKKQALPDHFTDSIQTHLLPIAKSINDLQKSTHKPVIISFNGAQGSGKSTLTQFISLLLNHHFHRHSIAISIDDFYLSKQQRTQLSQNIHPLLKTRGVPGTHDIELAIKTLKHLKICTPSNPCYIPVFHKAFDEQAPKSEWLKIKSACDIILFEGWCNHAPVQSTISLEQPINTLEQKEDTQKIWRTYANEQLKNYHKRLFSLCDQLIFIQIPGFSKVYEWRSVQEKKLASTSHQNHIMNNKTLLRFIQHYERITRNCLNTLPTIANTVITLNNQHQIKNVSINTNVTPQSFSPTQGDRIHARQ